MERFAPGTLVADRYEVRSPLGSGGMGEVWEAVDRLLGGRVALKVVRPDLVRNEQALARFRREMQLARRVTHPNVARVFDLGSHRDGDDEIVFLTMELLSGRTLADRLARGPLSVPDALPLARQIAEGLSAVHDAGVIHRDVKSSNVLLVPQGDGGERAVLTDFGLARPSLDLSGVASSMTAPEALVGTPAWMAPELLMGKDATAASDIFALGLVLYEMVTGQAPRPEATPYVLAARRLARSATSPRLLNPELSRRWERVILRCLHREPTERFVSASDVSRALAGDDVPPGPRERRSRRRRRWALVALAAGVGLVALVGPRAISRLRPTPGAGATLSARTAVAVLPFRALSGKPEEAWLGTALAEMLSAELAAGGEARLLPGEDVARATLEVAAAEESPGRETLGRLRASLGVDVVVHGSFLCELDGSLRLYVRADPAREGAPSASATEVGSSSAPGELAERAGASLRRGLDLRPVSADDSRALRARSPEGPEATRHLAEGLRSLRRFEPQAARAELERAVRASPGSALAHAWLAEALSQLGLEDRAREAARAAFELSGEISREERLSVEGRYRELAREWERALEVHRVLLGFFPDGLEYGLRLARVQVAAGRAKEALETVSALRRLPGPLGSDPRLDLAEAAAADVLSDFGRQQRAGARAAQAGRARGARLLEAAGLHFEGGAWMELGRYAEAIARLEGARRLFEEAGDAVGAARAANLAGLTRKNSGDLAGARRLFEGSVAAFRRAGHRRFEAAVLNNLASLDWAKGDLASALARYEEALRISQEIGDRRGASGRISNIGLVLKDQGRLAEARRRMEEALELSRALGDRAAVMVRLYNLADVLRLTGQLTEAIARLEEDLALSREAGQRRQEAYALHGLGEAHLEAGRLGESRRRLEAAAALRRELGEPGTEAETRIVLSRLCLDEADPESARRELSAARALLGKGSDPVREAWLHVGALRVSVELGVRGPELREQLAAVREATRETQIARLELEAALAEAAARQVEGQEREARRLLARTVETAREKGLVLSLLEARLLLASDPAARLAVAEEAERRGFRALAARARGESPRRYVTKRNSP